MINAEQKSHIVKSYQMHDKDTGSTLVQIELLSARIKDLQNHFMKHKQDKHSKRGMLNMVHSRRKLLKYIRMNDKKSYLDIMSRQKEGRK